MKSMYNTRFNEYFSSVIRVDYIGFMRNLYECVLVYGESFHCVTLCVILSILIFNSGHPPDCV